MSKFQGGRGDGQDARRAQRGQGFAGRQASQGLAQTHQVLIIGDLRVSCGHFTIVIIGASATRGHLT